MKRNSFWKNAGILLAVAAAYFVLSLPFARLTFSAGAAELRFSGFIPMLAGLLFGPAGALGCALGNFLIDLVHTFDCSDLFGTAGVFLMAYLPYKLWHTLFLPAGKNDPVFFGPVTSVLKYVLIAFISSVCAASVTAAGGELLGLYSFLAFFPQVALQYFDLSLLVGMLLFQILTGYTKLRPRIPWRAYEPEYAPRRYLADIIFLAAAMALAGSLFALDFRNAGKASLAGNVLCILLLCAIAGLAVLPVVRGGKKTGHRPKYQPVDGIQRQLITGFLALLCAVLVFYMATMLAHMYQENETGPEYWLYVLSIAAIASAVLVAVLSVVLKWIETHVTRPVLRTSAYAGHFVTESALTSEELTFPKTGNEIDGLGESIRHMTRDIRGYTRELQAKTAAEERLATEMNVARGIQMSLLPAAWDGTDFDIAAEVEPAREVGGDFYDFRALGQDKVFVAVADVSGKGVSAALFMVRAKTLMKARADLPVSEMMRQLNDELAGQNDAMMFVTVFAGIVDRRAMTFTYANAGHNPPVVLVDGKTQFLNEPPGIAAGAVDGAQYAEHTLQITEDFRLLLYTDGVTEAQDDAGAFYGESQLLLAAGEAFQAGLTARETVRAVRNSVDGFASGAPQADDITVLCLSLGETESGGEIG